MKHHGFLFFLLLSLLSGCGSQSSLSSGPASSPAAVQDGRDAPDTVEIALTEEGITAEELHNALAAYPELRKLDCPNCTLTAEEQLSLQQDYPDVTFLWPVLWGGQIIPSDAPALDLSGESVSAEELLRMLPLFPEATEVALGSARLDTEEITELREHFPDVLFRYEAELFGRSFDSWTEELDLSGLRLKDTAELEESLVHFPKLRKVVMCECGLDNETMDALNRKYEEIRFVWLVNVLGRGVRTDATYFIQYNLPSCRLEGSRAHNLRYCPDMIAVDLGHTGLVNGELDFLAYMPHLKYLIIADSHLTELPEISALKELVYLEAFLSPIKDYTPLLDCPSLTHLNLGYNAYMKDENLEFFRQMTNLEALWLPGARLSSDAVQELKDALPDCEIVTGYIGGSTDGGWRDTDAYRAMRDTVHMPYMK